MSYIYALDGVPDEDLAQIIATAKKALKNGMMMAVRVVSVSWEGDDCLLSFVSVKKPAQCKIVCLDGQGSPYVDPKLFIPNF